MAPKSSIPDAWDDDWTNVADVKTAVEAPTKLTKAEKRAQHQQLQKDLWSSAEDPSRNLWLEAKGALPLKQEFTPSMTLLSRKPQLAKKGDGMAGLTLGDEDDSEEEARKKRENELEERQRKAKLDREEKVRKYAEARERIMGSSAPTSPKVKSDSRESSHGRNDRRLRGNHSQPTSSRQSPARPTADGLFDPDDMSRKLPRREESTSAPRPNEPVRQPRGPDATGRAGFAVTRAVRPGA